MKRKYLKRWNIYKNKQTELYNRRILLFIDYKQEQFLPKNVNKKKNST